jgi:hypothetical protein
VTAQFIVDPAFTPVRVDGPFDKANFAPEETSRREELVTRGWRRLQKVQGLGIPISEYPLEEFRRKR